jgi:two-component system sensor histidine kinase EvgS
MAAEDGEAAMASWRAQNFDVLITDCNMPGISGYELAQRIRELEAREGRQRLPIIGCTADVLSDVGARCEAAGMDEWLSKPLKTARLASLLAQLTRPRSFDPTTLQGLAQADLNILQRMLMELEKNLLEELIGLQQAVAHLAWEPIDAALHRLKGICALIDAAPLALACGKMAGASRQGDEVSLMDHWPAVHSSVEQLLVEIRQEIAAVTSDPGPASG